MSQTNKINRITVAQMAPHIHHFNPKEDKVKKLYEWLKEWIKVKLESGEIKTYYFLPLKGDLAFHIGVSKGTIQNVYRLLEDNGIVESKQRVGTYIRDNNYNKALDKLTSKKEITEEKIKQFIKDNNFQEGDILIPLRALAKNIEISFATTRIAINSLVKAGILLKNQKTFIINNVNFNIKQIQQKTLSEKIAENLFSYIKKNLKTGDKLPSNSELAKQFNVSIKTIHDSLKILVKKGILITRRGKYGTVVAGENYKSERYCYEQTETKIRYYIIKNCKEGDKLPSIREFAHIFNISTKTIKTALDNLMEEGYITFLRGRNGGTFVIDIPENQGESYTWLAISSDYFTNNN